jgi:uncharacterized membrane protein YccC
MTLDLTDEEAAALTKHLRQALDDARYPLAPRLYPLKAILAEPPAPQPELPPALTRHGAARRARADGDGKTGARSPASHERAHLSARNPLIRNAVRTGGKR